MECVAAENTSYPCGGLNKHLLFRTDGTLFEAWNTTERSTGHCAMLDALTESWHMANCSVTANYVCVYSGTCRSSKIRAENNKIDLFYPLNINYKG